MRSPTGVLGALMALLTIPAAVLSGEAAAMVIHFGLGAAFAFLVLAVFDFRRAWWLTAIGVAATAGLATTFLLQGLGDVTGSAAIRQIAFDILGQWPESALVDVFLLWCLATAAMLAGSPASTFGLIVLAGLVCLEAFRYAALAFGETTSPALRLFFLLTFVWLLWESAKPAVPRAQSTRGASS